MSGGPGGRVFRREWLRSPCVAAAACAVASPTNPHPRLATPPCNRLAPHALLGLLVLLQPGAFATTAYWALATGGMAYINATNARRALDLLAPAPPGAKPHAA